MRKKYIIEIPEDKITDFVGSTHFLMPYMMAGHIGHHDTGLPIEPYIEPDLEQVRKEAYDKGFEDGKELCPDPKICYNNAYQNGLSDAWEAARKISMAEINGRCSWKSMKNIFGYDIPSKIFKNFTASEAIESLKIYEQKHDGEIKIGDEVDAPEMKPFIVTGFGYGDDEMDVYCHGITTGDGIPTSAKKMFCVRTGRHFPEIAALFRR